MSHLGEIDPRYITPFPRVHYHDGFDAFGMHFRGMGHGGHSDQADGGNNQLKRTEKIVLHLHGNGQAHQVGDRISVRLTKQQWQVEEVADLGVEQHWHGYESFSAQGYAYLVSVVAEVPESTT